MDFNIEQNPNQPIVYMRRIGAYGSENYKLMESLKTWATQRGMFINSIIYGIAHDNDNTPPDKCRYDVCLLADKDCPVDESVQKGEIPGGKYAVFTVPHTTEAVQNFWGSLIQVLQDQSLNYNADKPILERYKYKLVEAGECEFCVPLTD